MIKLLIDSDPIVYRSGFAAESTEYDTVLENKDGEIHQRYFRPKDGKTAFAILKEWEAAGYTAVIKEKITKAEPVDHALQIVGTTIVAIENAARDKFKTKVNAVSVLSGPGNFRYKIATIKPYKGNRDSSHIPVHYQAIRNFLTDIYRARVIHGREADDEVSIQAWEMWREWHGTPPTYVVASIDKDLDQIPGWHYDYMKHVFYFQDLDEARKQLWTQILAGDSGDNVPGCYGIGPSGAEEKVQEYLDAGLSARGIWESVVNEYDFSKLKAKCPYKDKGAAMVALETAQLVYMQQRPGELWMPPGETFGIVEGDIND